MKAEQIEKLTKDAKNWVASEKGQESLRKALANAQKTATQLEKARRINPDDLHRHFTL